MADPRWWWTAGVASSSLLFATSCRPGPPAPPQLRPAPGNLGWSYLNERGRWAHDAQYTRLDVLSTRQALARRDRSWWLLTLGANTVDARPVDCTHLRPTDAPDRWLCKRDGLWGLSGPEGDLLAPFAQSGAAAPSGGGLFRTEEQDRLVDRDGRTVAEAAHLLAPAAGWVVQTDRRVRSGADAQAALAAGGVARLDPATGATTPLPMVPQAVRDGWVLAWAANGQAALFADGADTPLRTLEGEHWLVGHERLLRALPDNQGVLLVDLQSGETVGNDLSWRLRATDWLAREHTTGFVDGLLPVWDPDAACGYLTPDGNEAFGFFHDWRQCSPFEGGRAVVQSGTDGLAVDAAGREVSWR